MPEGCGIGPTIDEEEAEYERARQARIDRYYQGESAADMAERIVELEDELGADVDGICTGMHADVAEAHAEVERLQAVVRNLEGDCVRLSEALDDAREANAGLSRDLRDADHWEGVADRMRDEIARLTSLVGYWEHRAEESAEEAGRLKDLLQYEHNRANSAIDRENVAEQAAEESAEDAERLARDLRVSEAKVGGAALFVDQAQARINMLENVVDAYDGIHGERDRYRLAWLSARRRAADEATFGMEALALRDEEIARLREELRQTTSAPRIVDVGPDGDGGTVVKLVIA